MIFKTISPSCISAVGLHACAQCKRADGRVWKLGQVWGNNEHTYCISVNLFSQSKVVLYFSWDFHQRHVSDVGLLRLGCDQKVTGRGYAYVLKMLRPESKAGTISSRWRGWEHTMFYASHCAVLKMDCGTQVVLIFGATLLVQPSAAVTGVWHHARVMFSK